MCANCPSGLKAIARESALILHRLMAPLKLQFRRRSSMRKGSSRSGVSISIVFAFTAILFLGMSTTSEENKAWQAGTIVEVKAHQADAGREAGAKQYDVSIKVAKKIYVALYTSELDQAVTEYYVGMRRTVQVNGDTIKINDLLGHTRTLKILSSKDAPQTNAK